MTWSRRRRPSRCTRRAAAVLSGRRGARRTRCWRCWARPTSPRGARCSSSTTRWCSRARCAGPTRPTPPCWRCPPARRSRSRSTATAAGSPATRGRGAAEAVSSARPTSPASAPTPLGLTNCLNFGNPEKPHVAWQLVEAVEGIRDACRALGVPVVGGNVSLYNEAPTGPIFPTPVIGMVGRLPDPARAGPPGLRARGRRDRAGGRLQRRVDSPAPSWPSCAARPSAGPLPALDEDAVRAAHDTVRAMVNTGALRSAHDIAEGGIAVAIAECCIAGGIGATRRAARGRRPVRRGARAARSSSRARRRRCAGWPSSAGSAARAELEASELEGRGWPGPHGGSAVHVRDARDRGLDAPRSCRNRVWLAS